MKKVHKRIILRWFNGITGMNSDTIKILVTGDFCPHNRIETLAINSDYRAIYNDFIDVFKGNDLNITDMECPLTTLDYPRPKSGPHQKAHPACIQILKYADFGLVAMANNHIMDYDAAGAKETIELCRQYGIGTVGIGVTPDEASKPFSILIKGKRIAILNYADDEFLTSTDGTLLCNPINNVRCFYDIKSAKESHDFVIIIIHAGNEFYELPSPRTKQLYRYLVDLGADAIISHHTHAFSGFEVYKTKPVFYGLGNFLYDWPGKMNSSWNRGYVVKLFLSDKLEFSIIPLKQCNDEPGVFHLDDLEKGEFAATIAQLNDIIQDDKRLELEFRKYCNSVFPLYDTYIEPYFGKMISAMRKRGLFPRLMTKRKRLFLLNITRCESHREVLLRKLKSDLKQQA